MQITLNINNTQNQFEYLLYETNITNLYANKNTFLTNFKENLHFISIHLSKF